MAIIQRTVLCCLIPHLGNNLGLTNPLNFKVSSLSYKSPKQYGIISLTGTDTTLEANAYMVSGDCTIGSVESSRNMLSSCKDETFEVTAIQRCYQQCKQNAAKAIAATATKLLRSFSEW